MRALVQRVAWARVVVAGQTVNEIGHGLLVFLGVSRDDSTTQADTLARKIAKLRIFADESNKMNRSVQQAGNAVLVVSQFTLYADTRRGNRPSYTDAAAPEPAEALYRHFSGALAACGLEVANGIFGADMQVSLQNDGPVTLWLEETP